MDSRGQGQDGLKRWIEEVDMGSITPDRLVMRNTMRMPRYIIREPPEPRETEIDHFLNGGSNAGVNVRMYLILFSPATKSYDVSEGSCYGENNQPESFEVIQGGLVERGSMHWEFTLGTRSAFCLQNSKCHEHRCRVDCSSHSYTAKHRNEEKLCSSATDERERSYRGPLREEFIRNVVVLK